jgi:hypothetical protein
LLSFVVLANAWIYFAFAVRGLARLFLLAFRKLRLLLVWIDVSRLVFLSHALGGLNEDEDGDSGGAGEP